MKKILVMCCLLVVMAMPSFAASWYWVGADRSSGQWYIDNASVYKNQEKGVALIWVKTKNPDGTINLNQIGISRDKAVMLFRSITYDAYGKVIYDVPGNKNDVMAVIPGTASEAVYKLVWG